MNENLANDSSPSIEIQMKALPFFPNNSPQMMMNLNAIRL
jgi:hypothetical protein